MFSLVARQLYSSTAKRLAEPTIASAAPLVLNFCTPHAPVHVNKVVNMVILPGDAGEYGVTAGHSPIISELQPGVVTVIHSTGESEKFFVSGGFALTHPNSVTDISVTDAFPLNAFDESAIKSGYADATKNLNSDNAVAKATAQIEANVFSSLARALGITL